MKITLSLVRVISVITAAKKRKGDSGGDKCQTGDLLERINTDFCCVERILCDHRTCIKHPIELLRRGAFIGRNCGQKGTRGCFSQTRNIQSFIIEFGDKNRGFDRLKGDVTECDKCYD